FFCRLQRDSNRQQFCIREDESVRKRWCGLLFTISSAPNAMIQKHPARLEHGTSTPKIFGKVPFADVLHHPDADDFIEAAQLGHLAIIEETGFALGREASLTDSFLGKGQLPFAHGNSDCMYSVLAGSVQNQPSPPTTDIEQAFPRLQTKFAAD